MTSIHSSHHSWALAVAFVALASLHADAARAIDRRVQQELPTSPSRAPHPSEQPSVQPAQRPITRITVDDERELQRFRAHYEKHAGWLTCGITYGRVGPLTSIAALQFLNDGLLVGSYDEGGHRVFVYAFNDTGSERVMLS